MENKLDHQQLILNITKNWKKSIVKLMDIEEVWIPQRIEKFELENFLKPKESEVYLNDLKHFLKIIKFDEKLLINENYNIDQATIFVCDHIFRKLKDLELVTFEETFERYDIKPELQTKNNTSNKCHVNMYKVSMNQKGLDVALKIQEHRDSEKRFKEQQEISKVQQEISKTLKKNSSKSLYTSWVALFISFILIALAIYRICIADQQLEIAKKRLTDVENKYMEENIGKKTNEILSKNTNKTAAQNTPK